MPAVTFSVPGNPVPQPRPRVATRGGFARAYVPSSHPVHAYRRAIADTARVHGVNVSDGAVAVELRFTFERPKSHRTKTGIKATAPTLPREDVDNLAKACLDGLTCVAWHDDKQVADLHATKQYGDEGKTEVTIHELPADV